MWKTTICLILMIQNVIHITCTSVHNNTFIDWSLITDSTIHKLYAFPLHFIACLLTFASPHTRELQNKVTWGLRQNKQSTKRREFSASKMTIHCIRTAILWTTTYKINIRYGGGGGQFWMFLRFVEIQRILDQLSYDFAVRLAPTTQLQQVWKI